MNDAELRERTLTLSSEEVAKRLGLRPSTLRNWRSQGRGPVFLRLGNKIRYRPQDVADWLDGKAEERPHE